MNLTTVLIIILIILVAVLVALYFFGRRMQERQAAQQPAFDAAKQTISILVIDKKKLRISQTDFPQLVKQQVPWYAKWMKIPVVKAKVGARIMSLMADAGVYEQLPLNRECKVVVSGIYIAELKSIRGGSIAPLPKKRSLLSRITGRR